MNKRSMFFDRPDRDDQFLEFHGIKPLRPKSRAITTAGIKKLLLAKPDLTNTVHIAQHFCTTPSDRHLKRVSLLLDSARTKRVS